MGVIDQRWFSFSQNSHPQKSVAAAKVINQNPAVVVVPKFSEFVDEAVVFYANFVTTLLAQKAALAKYETPDHELILNALYDRVGPNLEPPSA